MIVLDRVPERHPDVSKRDAEDAWNHCIACAPAIDVNPDRYIAVGIDGKGRLLELVVIRKDGGMWLVIHAQCPPQKAIREKLGLGRARR